MIRGLWNHVNLFLIFGLMGCSQWILVQTVPDRPIPEVETYLMTSDDQEANRLLVDLMQYSVLELTNALRAQREFPPVSVGLLPGQVMKIHDRVWGYGLYVPETYDPEQAYPLVLCLHGAGFNGDAYLERWQPRLGESYLLVCPSVDFGAWWTMEAETFVMALVDYMIKTYHVDTDRIYLTGMSNGAIGTYLIGLNHVDRFAALIPMSGPLPPPLLPLLDNARTTPFYIIHGREDRVIPVRYSQEVWAYLLDRGYTVHYQEHGRTHPMAGGHFFPREELSPLVDWMEKQSRTTWPRRVTVVKDRDHPGRVHWIQIDAIDSEVGSFWASEQDSGETQRLKEGMYARVEAIAGGDNQIDVTTEKVGRYTVFLSDQLVDLDRPVIIKTNGKISFQGIVEPDRGVLLEEARASLDPAYLFQAAIEIVLDE